MRAFALPRTVVLPVIATALADAGFSAAPLFTSGLPRFFGVTSLAIGCVLVVALAQGLKGSFLTVILTVASADFFFLGPPLEFGLTKPCHYTMLATVAVVSTLGASLIALRRSAAQRVQPVGMALPDSRDVLICSAGDEGIKAVHIVRDI